MAEPGSLGFSRHQHLKRGHDFQRIRNAGQRLVNGCIVANWVELKPGAGSRLGVITSSKLGNAVVRSRARRLLREAYRLHQHELRAPVDLVLVARASIVGRKLVDVERDYLSFLRRAKLMASEQ
jgi:ribonuclease P protein component